MAEETLNHPCRVQVEWGVKLFRSFLLFAAKRESFPLSLALELEKEIEALAGGTQKDPMEAAKALNQAIASANQQIKKDVDPILYAPFPSFTCVEEKNARSAVLDQLDMVERTLSEAAHAKFIGWSQEGILFAEILKLFTAIEQGQMHPSEAMAILSGAIQKINQELPADFRLPVIDLTAYEVNV